MIRKIEEKDKEIFLKMAKDFYESDAVCYHVSDEAREATFKELMRSDEYLECFFFEVDGEIAGYSMLNKCFSHEAGGIVYWVEDLMVLPKFQGKGIGTEFFSFLEENRPAVRYRLETEPGNKRSAKLYKRLGYEFCPYVQWIKQVK